MGIVVRPSPSLSCLVSTKRTAPSVRFLVMRIDRRGVGPKGCPAPGRTEGECSTLVGPASASMVRRLG